MPAPKAVRVLVEKFRKARHADLGETQLRREFLDPFFAALGWDVENKKNYLPHLREVTHEYHQEVDGSQKTADYLFRRGEKGLFFVEAKAPGKSLKDDPKPAVQLRRYSFSAGHALGVLTDFEEFAVYDGRVEPKPGDRAAVARVLYLTYDEYDARWDELAGIFSYDAVWRTGGFDEFAGEAKGGAHSQVDKSFLSTIERWRDELARNIANRNRDLDLEARDLNYAVQTIINRIIFLKVCEDRRLEDDGRLKRAAEAPDGVYARLLELFLEADHRYNSGLFHFREEKGRPTSPDTLTPGLAVDDRVLRGIIADLYDGAYEFGVIPVEIIGQVYEQFLGKVIRVTPAGLAKVEYKPEVRKAGGVYYTPRYIVDYIVAQTVGELLKKCKTPAYASKLRILDPACGSGSFLLGAYQHLLDWHLAHYVKAGPAKYKEVLIPTGAPGPNSYRLSIAEKKRILLNNIYGVDIDPQAVEVTKLSLLLKALEGETREALGAQLTLYKDRALPDLGANIKCGNSLIGPDYFEGRLEVDEEEWRRVNPFDWADEKYGFGTIMKAGGFDAVIGNPPYLSFSGRQKPNGYEDEVRYWEATYFSRGWLTTHSLFIIKGMRIIRKNGFLSYIVPDQIGHLGGYKPLREEIMKTEGLIEVKYWGEDVFKGVTTPALTFVIGPTSDRTKIIGKDGIVKVKSLNPGDVWVLSEYGPIISKMRDNGISLGKSVGDPGVHTGNCSKKIIIKEGEGDGAKVEPVLEGKDISRYFCGKPKKYLRLDYEPKKGEYFTIRDIELYEKVRFVIRQTASYPIVGPKLYTEYFRNSLLSLYDWPPYDIRYVVAILNSKAVRFYYKKTVSEAGQEAFPQVKVKYLREIPMPETDVARHDRMVSLVDRMLDLHKRKQAARTPAALTALEKEIADTDAAIDKLVYELYGLTEEEIKVVESGV